MMISKDIYQAQDSADLGDVNYPIKPYKWKRIFFSRHFRALWNGEPALTQTQYIYQMCTHMWRQRLNQHDIYTLVVLWFRKFELNCDYAFVRIAVKKTKEFTLEYRRSQKKAEKARAKARKASVAGSEK
jgi:hypothetical protein